MKFWAILAPTARAKRRRSICGHIYFDERDIRKNITALWFVYWLGFATYAYSMASLGAWILQSGLRMACFYILCVLAVASAVYYRNRRLDEGFCLVFEDEMEPVVRTLDLSAPGTW